MREIKFRAWDNLLRQMMHNVERAVEMSRRPEFEVMQYTGLKDKNGKEIYEGDIVANEYVKLPVIFEWGSFMWGDMLRLSEAVERIEVIGNIYENKELLNEQST